MEEASIVAMVFSGGLGLGAYHAGVYEAFITSAQPLHWITGSSAGAITAALIAGGPPNDATARLRNYWGHSSAIRAIAPDPTRHLAGWMDALAARLFGSIGHFRPRLPLNPLDRLGFPSIYDLSPTRRRVRELVDFAYLNAGEMRVTIAATDLKSGDPVLFDSEKEAIEIDHILASCGFIPEFAPLWIGDRLIGDGGLSLNAPFDPVLEQAERPVRLFIMDLFPRDGPLPNGLEAALERKNDLLFGNQTFLRLKQAVQSRSLALRLQNLSTVCDEIYLLSYRPGAEEAGPEKSFDFSHAAIAQRWRAGFLDMQHVSTASELAHGIRSVRRPTQ